MVLATYTVAWTLTACSGEDDRKEEKKPNTPTTPTNEEPKNNDGPTANGLTVLTDCTPCNGGGKCPTCKGSGKGCKTCGGTGKHCDTCGGTGKHCSTCGGTGKHCSTCGGTGKHCAWCGGTGTCGCDNGNCPKCGGSGKVDCGYCGGNGRCTTCGGLGYNYYGGKQYTCTTCNGSKRCKWCGGDKTQKCSKCHGDGNCPECGGDGKCPDCDGNPKCPTCNGNPVCKSCDGKAVCKSCNGTASCKTCGGDGHCADCTNSDGKCKTCSGTGEVTLSSLNFSKEGSNTKVSVHSDGTWNASTDADWIKLSSPSGSGNSSFTITADANPTTSSRSGKVTFSYSKGSTSVNVKQEEGTATISIKPQKIDITAEGGDKEIIITSNTSWNVAYSETWLSLSKKQGNGNDTLKVTIDKNPLGRSRSAQLTFNYGKSSKQTIDVNQSAGEAQLTCSPQKLDFQAKGGEQNLTVTSNAQWTVSSSETWCSYSLKTGVDNGTVKITVKENATTSPRSAQITIKYGSDSQSTISVNQEAGLPTLTVSPEQVNVNANGGNYELKIKSNTSWAVKSDAPYITLSASQGSGDGTVKVVFGANDTTSERTGIITISYGDNQKKTVSAKQYGATASLTVSPTSKVISETNSNFNIEVTAKPSKLDWYVTKDASWLHFENSGSSQSKISKTGSQSVKIYADKNTTNGSRSATLKFNSEAGEKTVKINQERKMVLKDMIVKPLGFVDIDLTTYSYDVVKAIVGSYYKIGLETSRIFSIYAKDNSTCQHLNFLGFQFDSFGGHDNIYENYVRYSYGFKASAYSDRFDDAAKVKAEFEKIGIPMPRYEQPAGIPHYYSEFINGCQYSISASGYPDYSIAIGIEFHK